MKDSEESWNLDIIPIHLLFAGSLLGERIFLKHMLLNIFSKNLFHAKKAILLRSK